MAETETEGTPGARPVVGLVGAGVMGGGMGANLLAAGFPLLTVAHRNRETVDRLVAAGARDAASLAALARESDVVLLCLPTADVASSVLNALLPSLAAGRLVIDTGTSRPEVSRAMEAACADRGIAFVEAPVAGGKGQAEAGELGAIVGGSPEAVARARPVLEAFTATIQHFGPVGTASVAKLVNNYMVMGIAALVAEAYALADRAGVDWEKLYDVMIRGAGDSGVLRRMAGNAIAGDFRGYVFPVKGAAKDLSYFLGTARELGGVSPLAAAVARVFEDAVEAGHGDRLMSELLAPDVRDGRTSS